MTCAKRKSVGAPQCISSARGELSQAGNGGNLFNQRYSPLTQINRDNVKDLKARWRTHLDGSGAGPQYSGQGQPLFYQGVLYVVTGADDVFALDVNSGAHLWSYAAKLDPAWRANLHPVLIAGQDGVPAHERRSQRSHRGARGVRARLSGSDQRQNPVSALLRGLSWDLKVIITIATNGKNQDMPPFRGALKPEELRDVAGFNSHDLFKQPLP
ncbi:MAG TPA: hypothetical protein VIY90_20035 [Steroidobacteraceae bacterium]